MTARTYEQAQDDITGLVALWLLTIDAQHRGDRLVNLINNTVVPTLNRRSDFTPAQRDKALLDFASGVLHRLHTMPVTEASTIGRA